MTYLIMMLAVAAAMVLFREPLGRALARAVGAIDWRWAVILALLAVCAWGILHHVQAPISVTGDALTGLFDTFAYSDLLIAYSDLAIAAAVALLNRRTLQMVGRLAVLAGIAAHRVIRRAARAVRAPAKPRCGPPDPDEPEPGAWGAIFALA